MRTVYRLLSLYRLFAALASGKSQRIGRYARNRAKARLLGKMGFWR